MRARSGSEPVRAYEQTPNENSRIHFERSTRTFRLYSRSTLYAFHVDDHGRLEHLYWGPALDKSLDLLYLRSANVPLTFETADDDDDIAEKNFHESPAAFQTDLLGRTTSEIRAAWKEHRGQKSDVYRRRVENTSWRLFGVRNQDPHEVEKIRKRAERLKTLPTLGSQLSEEKSNRRRVRKTMGKDARAAVEMPFAGKPSKITRSATALGLNKLTNLSQSTSASLQNAIGDRFGKGSIKHEYSDYGTGDFRPPSFRCGFSNGSTTSPVRYVKHVIFPGRSQMDDPCMPHVRVKAEDSAALATTLVVTLQDHVSGFEIDLIYTVMHHHDAIIRSTRFRNAASKSGKTRARGGQDTVLLSKAMSTSLDFECEAGGYYLTHLAGSWARERHIKNIKLQQGCFTYGSTRGTSSHAHNPFVMLTRGAPPNEEYGMAFGFGLVYSGNHIVEAHQNEVGRVRLNIGINPETFNWNLQQGESFQTPECVCVCSPRGTGGLSREFHCIIREHILPPSWSLAPPPPIMLNSWEARYFDVSHDAIVQMAVDAKKLGIEMIVLDDGWFGERHSDTTSLGDWYPNMKKFPLGIRGLAHELDSMGMKMGLWFEPEMVSADSELYRKHPDWCLHVPGRPRQTGRNQLVLDMGRKDVRDYLFDAISNILQKASISYVKWDMNRYLTEVFSTKLPAQDQGRVAHQFILGTYSLLHKLFIEEFPNVLLESCSGGGGRFDMGMLFFSPQIWTSDNTDAKCRLNIQYGTSLVYPAQCMGSHYSVVPNHITMGMSRSRTRALVAMCGTFGYELDLDEFFLKRSLDNTPFEGSNQSEFTNLSMSPVDHGRDESVDYKGSGTHVGIHSDSTLKEQFEIKEHIRVYRETRHIVRGGDLFRIWSPFKKSTDNASEFSACAWMYVLPDQSEALVFIFNMGTPHWSTLLPRIRLKGLSDRNIYSVSEPLPNSLTRMQGNLKVVETEDPVYLLGADVRKMSGGSLMHLGLPIKFFSDDDAILFHLTTKSPIVPNVLASSNLGKFEKATSSTSFSSLTRSTTPPPYISDMLHEIDDFDCNVEF